MRLQGIDPARVGDVTDLRDDLVAGSLDALDPAAGARDGDAGAIPASWSATSSRARSACASATRCC